MVQTNQASTPSPAAYAATVEDDHGDAVPEYQSLERKPLQPLERQPNSYQASAAYDPLPATSSEYPQASDQKPYDPYEMKDVWETLPQSQPAPYNTSFNGGIGQPYPLAPNPNYYPPPMNYGGAQAPPIQPPRPINHGYAPSPQQNHSSSSKKGSGLLSMLGGSSKKGYFCSSNTLEYITNCFIAPKMSILPSWASPEPVKARSSLSAQRETSSLDINWSLVSLINTFKA